MTNHYITRGVTLEYLAIEVTGQGFGHGATLHQTIEFAIMGQLHDVVCLVLDKSAVDK